jgi:hypothetical protein
VRLKFFGHATTEDLCSRLNGAPSIFDAVGRGESRYRFTDRFADRHDILPRLDLGAVSLDMIQFHALDMLGHWQLSTSERLHHVLKETDEFVRRLHEMCEEAGVTFLLVSDHGQEPIRHTIYLKAQLEELDLPRSEYAYFLQPVAARFWFHSERARAAVTDRLSRSENGHFLSYQDLAPYNVAFEDGAYGESYFVPDPGYLLFPYDFHHPLANLYMGLTDSQQRDRLRCPIHVAYHGYLPTNDCEEGLLIIFDDNYSLEERRISLLDVAPSLLAMMNCDAPPQMVGQSKLGA